MGWENLKFIGLITDFGLSPYPGIMKAVIKSINPEAEVIDLDHSVPSFNLLAAAYVVYSSYRWMPVGSIIVSVVDPGVGSAREALIVETNTYTLIGPNNGILYPVIESEGFRRGVVIDYSRLSERIISEFKGRITHDKWVISYTFHGRDVFAPAAALLSKGVDMEELGRPIEKRALKKTGTQLDHVEKLEEGYRVSVVYIDKFGNVALNVKPGLLGMHRWKVVAIQTPTGTFNAIVRRTFSEASPGDLVVYVNSFGFVEIAVNQGNAARKLGVEIGEKITIIPMEEA
jgi:S-adenosylmethionine hydrolase